MAVSVLRRLRRLFANPLKTLTAEVCGGCGGSIPKSLKTLCGGLRKSAEVSAFPKGNKFRPLGAVNLFPGNRAAVA